MVVVVVGVMMEMALDQQDQQVQDRIGGLLEAMASGGAASTSQAPR
jgi:hypothetical protein